jgi:energy-coupling factor transport system permease protein
MIHPVIRIITLVVFAVLISRADLIHMLLAGLILFVVYSRLDAAARQMAVAMIYRMRWFFISLLLVYGWLTPDPLTGETIYWGWPSVDGLTSGAKQVFGLMQIILAVNVLLVVSRREELIQAIYWLARPLAWVGLSRARLALRLVLVLDRVAMVREQVGHVVFEQRPSPERRWTRIVAVAAKVFQQSLDSADAIADEDFIFQPLNAPPWYQWGLPILLIPLFVLLPLQ